MKLNRFYTKLQSINFLQIYFFYQENKRKFAQYVKEEWKVDISPSAMFDVQVPYHTT